MNSLKMERRRQHSTRRRRLATGLLICAAVSWAGRATASGEFDTGEFDSKAASDRKLAFDQELDKGRQEASEGDLSSAMANLGGATALAPANPDGWYELGVLYGQMGDFGKAEAAFRRSLQLNVNSAKSHYRLGLTLIANPQIKLDWLGAIAEFRAALRLQPDYPEALNYLGAGLTATGDTTAAVPELEYAVRLAPAEPVGSLAHFNLGIALEKSGRPEEAAREYSASVAARGGYPEASSALGKLLARIGKPAGAELALRAALRANPDLADAHYALARLLQSLKRADEAAVEFDESRSLNQREVDAIESSRLSNLALETAAKGDMNAAVASLRKAVALKPDYGVPHLNLGLVLADTGDLPNAIQELIKAISLLPGEARPWFDLGRVQRRSGDLGSALQSVAWAARLAPEDGRIQAELKSARETDGTFASVSGQAQRPDVGASTDSAEGHLAFGQHLAGRHDWMGAVGEFRRSLQLGPGSVAVRRGLADAYAQLGDREQAMLEYRKVLLQVQEDAEAHLALGSLLFNEGHASEAATEFRAALRTMPDSVEARTGLEQAQKAARKE